MMFSVKDLTRKSQQLGNIAKGCVVKYLFEAIEQDIES